MTIEYNIDLRVRIPVQPAEGVHPATLLSPAVELLEANLKPREWRLLAMLVDAPEAHQGIKHETLAEVMLEDGARPQIVGGAVQDAEGRILASFDLGEQT